MRLLVTSSLLAVAVFCLGAGFFSNPERLAGLTSGAWETSAIGAVWSDDFNRATLGTNWVSSGAISASITNNSELLLTGSGGTLLYQPWLICSDSWTLRWKQRFIALDGSSYGVGVGLKNMQSYDLTHSAYAAFLFGTGGALGKFFIEQFYSTQFRDVTNGAAMVLAAGDEVDCSLTRAGWDMIATASNRANGQVSSCAFTYSIAQSHESPTISGVCLYAVGGTLALDDISFTINHRKPARFIVIGDSISDGFGVSSYAAEYPRIIQSNYTQVVCNDSSSWNVTSNSLSVLPEILAHQPQTAILMIGGNDILLGVPTATWKAQYSNLVAQLQANSVLVKHCLPSPRNNPDLRPLKDWILTTYPATNVIDTWTPLVTNTFALKPAYDSGDGVHPNDAGHLLIGSIIRTNLP